MRSELSLCKTPLLIATGFTRRDSHPQSPIQTGGMVQSMGALRRVRLTSSQNCRNLTKAVRISTSMLKSYTLSFQTLLFSILPPIFVQGFKALCAVTLPPETPDSSETKPTPTIIPNDKLWHTFEVLGLLDRYEAIIASVGYERIEEHVKIHCTGNWTESMLDTLRTWMQNHIVPWMLLMYGRGANNSMFFSLTSSA